MLVGYDMTKEVLEVITIYKIKTDHTLNNKVYLTMGDSSYLEYMLDVQKRVYGK